jgi:hypothetical protein
MMHGFKNMRIHRSGPDLAVWGKQIPFLCPYCSYLVRAYKC